MTKKRFRSIIKETNWEIYHENNLSLFNAGGIVNRYPVMKIPGYLMKPFLGLPVFEEFLSAGIVYILEKQG